MLKHLEEELIGHDEKLEDAIFDKYRELRIKNKGMCGKCINSYGIKNDSRPVSFFVVGEIFQEEQYKVLFCGKTVQDGWGEHSKIPDPIDHVSGFIDARKNTKKILFLPFWSTYPFWHCVKEICQDLWGLTDAEELWKKIAITNLVKCSTSEGRDETPDLLKTNCIQGAKFFEEEVKIIQPTHIILFTGSEYDKCIKTLDFGYEDIEDISSEHDKQALGANKREVLWWRRKFSIKDEVKMQFLRTYHPGYFKKQDEQEEFSRIIAEWIKTSALR